MTLRYSRAISISARPLTYLVAATNAPTMASKHQCGETGSVYKFVAYADRLTSTMSLPPDLAPSPSLAVTHAG
jgi:hypothetical protein